MKLSAFYIITPCITIAVRVQEDSHHCSLRDHRIIPKETILRNQLMASSAKNTLFISKFWATIKRPWVFRIDARKRLSVIRSGKLGEEPRVSKRKRA